jgi:hypothetical protein
MVRGSGESARFASTKALLDRERNWNGRHTVTLIDQRILIDAPPPIIWEFVSDPYRLAQWHAGYSSVSVLTTQQTGLGTRRRCAVTGGGKDVIEQITAWVDGLGYEYEFIEGGPYRLMRGRIRLQPGPDGTGVQWTVEYRPKGPFGLLRDWLGGRKQFAAMMAASLRELRQQVNALGLRMDDAYRARLGIQGRLNVAERAHYQRRHPVPGADPPAPASVAESAPPPAGEVTAPEPPATLPKAPLERAVPAAEAEAAAPAPLVPAEPVLPPPVIAPPAATAPPGDAEPDYRRVTPPRGIPAVQRPPAADAPSPFARPASPGEKMARPQPTPPPDAPSPPPPGGRERADRPEILPPPTSKTDTGEISIWEVFGLRRPSERDEDALQGLIQSVEARKTAELRRQLLRRGLKRPPRVRLAESAGGLRSRRGGARNRVRASAYQRDRSVGDRNENGA